MRVIKSEIISAKIRDLFIECNYYTSPDINKAVETSLKNEKSVLGKAVLSRILENNKLAAIENIPMCQDTGMAIVFIELGNEVQITGKSLNEAVNDGISEACREGYLRASVVRDPLFERKNTENNVPAVIYIDSVRGDKIKITLGAKGFGSENMSRIKMLSPADGVEGVEDFVLDTVKIAGSKPCPPIVVGVGIGGTFDKAAVLSKKASLRPLNLRNPDINYAKLESGLLAKINGLEIGPAGFGGSTTALAVNIESYPTHIAGLPVAVNICCHVSRHREVII